MTAILAAAVEEAGGCAQPLGIGPELVLSRLVDEGLATSDMVILSGGTSKCAGDTASDPLDCVLAQPRSAFTPAIPRKGKLSSIR